MAIAIDQLKSYYHLTKPGIIRGNLVTMLAGFFLASQHHIELGLLLATSCGLVLVIASACVFNNYIDRGIDQHMARTKQRALVTGAISARNAIIFASALGLIGSAILFIWTNVLALGLALLGMFAYVVLYGYVKRRSVHGTLVGTISGAIPPVVGYCAVTNRIDLAAIILFTVVTCWQMPHFFAIAIYRQSDYAAAGIPVLPIKRGVANTKWQILAYIAVFTIVASLLTVFGYADKTYEAVVLIIGLAWLGLGLKGFKAKDNISWAKGMFHFSLIAITALCLAIGLSPYLP